MSSTTPDVSLSEAAEDAVAEAKASLFLLEHLFFEPPDQIVSGGDRRRFQRAKVCCFLTGDGLRAAYCYRNWCEGRRRPFVTVSRNPDHTYVCCDMHTAGSAFDAASKVQADALCDRDGWIVWDEVDFKRVSIGCHPDQAETIAFRLYEIAMDCRPGDGGEGHDS